MTKEKKSGKTRGRPKKKPLTVKDMLLSALQGAGGAAYLTKQAEENPRAFLSLLGKVLPMQVTGEDGGAVKMDLEASAAVRELLVKLREKKSADAGTGKS